ncbi:aquaporin [Myceligenerans pegani]|uniref:Aquaporin n=1 Tax=Myceligenerans pegani TaxID=2776917 RepID=A0ABR9N045_9MICO|nr:aquaporin [Myceligenerans sp. TRM 65318]MBE1877023.1 aquaporin [Myceligenerans sp. TRM 65318]MBE3019294.1 aquaporin [Myceligenerans sp. TRM 65318]
MSGTTAVEAGTEGDVPEGAGPGDHSGRGVRSDAPAALAPGEDAVPGVKHRERVAGTTAGQVEELALWRRAVAEGLGTCLLVTVVVGSGIMAQQLSDDVGLQLLENSLATTLGLAVLIAVLGPVSGAHLNPVVTLVDWFTGRGAASRTDSGNDPRTTPRKGGGTEDARPPGRLAVVGTYVAAQIAGGIAGAVLANAMFVAPTALATTDRATAPHLLAEVVATAGLVLVVLGLLRSGREAWVPAAVGSYIGAAYWFTSSTSFANPAVTVGRMFSDTFAGIAPGSVLPFVAAQLVGGALAVGLAAVLFPRARQEQLPA